MIPVNEPWLGVEETELTLQALGSGWISGQGEFVDEFEARWAEVCERRHGIAVTSGTAALETALRVLDLPAGSRVILPAFTMISCLAALIRNGLVPTFVDADPETWCMDPAEVAEAVGPETRAVMIVHIYGQPVDVDPVLQIAKQHDLKVIEDAAEAHGARYRGRPCGSFGDVSVFSFYSNKIVTTGEGGMVLCDDDALARHARGYRNLHFGERDRFRHDALGQNYRLSNLAAAIGCAQVAKLPRALERKRRMAEAYDEELASIPDLQRPPRVESTANVHWVYGVVLGDSHPFDAAVLGRRLRDLGIETRPFFVGLHEQPVVRKLGFNVDRRFPVTERLSQRGLYLPSGLTLGSGELNEVCAAMRSCLEPSMAAAR